MVDGYDEANSGWTFGDVVPPLPYGRVMTSSKWPFRSSK
jgi:hypothetical protein